jgi:AraC-like DNA-binding protein
MESALFSGLVIRLAGEAGQYRAVDILRVGIILIDIRVALLSDELENQASPRPEGGKHALLSDIKSFIRQNLADPELSPAAVAAAHHISTRSLQRLFESQDTTVTEWIRSHRLERCRRDLVDPRLRDEPIGLIAKRWGFQDAAYFSRVFRAAYGVSPRGCRDGQQGRVVGVDGQLNGGHLQ